MTSTGRAALPWLIVSQLLVTLCLLSFAYGVDDPGIRNIVIGAVIAHWLSESNKLGRQVSDERMAKIIGGGEVTSAVVTATRTQPTATKEG